MSVCVCLLCVCVCLHACMCVWFCVCVCVCVCAPRAVMEVPAEKPFNEDQARFYFKDLLRGMEFCEFNLLSSSLHEPRTHTHIHTHTRPRTHARARAHTHFLSLPTSARFYTCSLKINQGLHYLMSCRQLALLLLKSNNKPSPGRLAPYGYID